MNVILLERVGRLGGLGDEVNVRPGFARNFLIPQGKAKRATDAAKAEFEARRAERRERMDERRSRMGEMGGGAGERRGGMGERGGSREGGRPRRQ